MTESTPVSTHFSLDALDMAVAARWHSPSQQHTSSPLSASQQQQHHRQKTPTRRGGSGLPAQQEPQSERRAGSSETVRRGLGGRRLFRRSSSSRGSARQGQAPSTMMITQTTTRDPETVTYSVYPYNDGRRPRYGGYRHHDEYDEYDDIPTALDIGFRIANATTHLAACVVLLAIIGSFLSSLRLADGGSGHRKIL